MGTYVVEMPRTGRPLHEGTLAACRRFVGGREVRGTTRLAIVVSAEPPDDGPDAAVAVPLTAFAAWEARAAEIVASWDRTWLLIESMPRFREEARAGLLQAVASALIESAVVGVDADGRPDDIWF